MAPETLPDTAMPRVRKLALRTRVRQGYRLLFPSDGGTFEVAAAVFVGVFIGVLPTVGFALLLTSAAAALLRVPQGPALVSSFLANPPTLFGFFYPLGYVVGCRLTGTRPLKPQAFLSELEHLNGINGGPALARLWADSRPHLLAWATGMPIVALSSALLLSATAYWVMHRRRLGAAGR